MSGAEARAKACLGWRPESSILGVLHQACIENVGIQPDEGLANCNGAVVAGVCGVPPLESSSWFVKDRRRTMALLCRLINEQTTPRLDKLSLPSRSHTDGACHHGFLNTKRCVRSYRTSRAGKVVTPSRFPCFSVHCVKPCHKALTSSPVSLRAASKDKSGLGACEQVS